MILITGASGRVPRRTAELLARNGCILRLMTRSPQNAPKLTAAQTVRGDFAEPATLADAFAGVTTALVVSASGEPGARARLHRNAFQAAAQAGVQHVVYLSLQGAAPDSMYPYSREHFLSEQYLLATGLSCTILRNAFYLDMFLEKFKAENVVRGPAKNGRGAFVSREDVARTAAAALLKKPSGIYDLTGPESLSVADIAERLSAIMQRDLRYEDEPAGTTRERLSKRESLAWRVDLAVGWFEAIAAGDLERVSENVQHFTGAAPLNLDDYSKAFPELFRPL